MLKIYKSLNNSIKHIENIEKDCWLNMINPTDEEIAHVVDKTKISKDLIIKLRDEEEVPRIEIDGNSTLIVLDCPYYEKNNNHYATYPLGIIINKDYILTISSRKQEVLKIIRNNDNIQTNLKSRMIIQILFYNSRLYIKYLKLIDKNIDKSEKILKDYTKNDEFIKLLNIEKSLVYFINSLRDNHILTEKLSKGTIIPLYDEDLELLEDAQIENKQGIDMANTYREILGSVSDAYANIISNNLNEAMKILTSITILFSVPTMISSFLGMNVPLGNFSKNSYAVFQIFLFSIVLSLVVAIYLKKKRLL